MSVAPLTNTQLYQTCLILADFRREQCFLCVGLTLISRRAFCQRCLATVLCVSPGCWPSSGVHIMKSWATTMQGLPLGLISTEDGAKTGVHTLHLTCSLETLPLCWFSVFINKRTVPTHSSAGNVVQLTQYFSSMCTALSLISSTACTGLGSVCL